MGDDGNAGAMWVSQASAGHLLQLIRSGQATTRGELQRVTGLARSTVSSRLDQLFGAGWIREAAAGPSTGGRPAMRLEFDAGHGVVLAAVLETRHGRAAVLDLAGRILAEQVGDLLIDVGPEKVLGQVGDWFAALLAELGVDAGAVCGIGLSVPGPVEASTGTVVQPPIMPGWDGYPIPDRMRQVFRDQVGGDPAVPVLVDNDANLMAYAEQRLGHPDCAAFLLVKVSTGIGAGIVVDGQIFRGIDGGAGDIGHIRLHDAAEALCMCGSYGCLAAVASGRALARQLTDMGIPTASGSGVRELLSVGQPDALRLARSAGRRVGDVLATVVTLVNPGVLMIAGDLAGAPFVTGVRERLYQLTMPRTTTHLEVVTSRLGDRAGLTGAALHVVEHLYAPAQADLRLSRQAAA
ncbi:ROK family protein [Streptomyces aidingensis]|uniref:Sugar kinase of the NBD/HSP70 family, may contain an N-terminal HTH domain n=1 Tax=Streptomyces aidingensis TaxID=910347 RepID=A0A1I1FR29_9ACTN|nr:ROK family protein [Streptomyces aidingensis]SFC01466.1 Sugar kinase of the NBD/HSP70 family, may contain an N-terminal HTH domain [Streptomyces aidingensis]